MNARKLIHALALAGAGFSVVLLGAGCDTIAAGDTGRVSDRWRDKNRGGYRFYVEVDADHGPKDSGEVSPEVWSACDYGDRWPDCRERVKSKR